MSELIYSSLDLLSRQVSFDHLRRITDGRGIIQHCVHSMPDPETGFCVDDNARALIAAVMHFEQFNDPKDLALIRTYLEFLRYTQKEDGKFHNFVDYRGFFLDEEGSQDSFGRAVWACGYVFNSPELNEEFRARAQEIFLRAFPHILGLKPLRSQAFSILGLYYYLQAVPQAGAAVRALFTLAERMVDSYQLESGGSWHWFEDRLTYCNARLSQALYLAYRLTDKSTFLRTAEESTRFLLKYLMRDGVLTVVGNKGWFEEGGKLALYDQQPVDAGCMVELLATAYEATGNEEYLASAKHAFEWFTGRNISGQVMCDPETGSCYDGLEEGRVNSNQGAESTLSFLLASLTLRRLLLQDAANIKNEISKIKDTNQISKTYEAMEF